MKCWLKGRNVQLYKWSERIVQMNQFLFSLIAISIFESNVCNLDIFAYKRRRKYECKWKTKAFEWGAHLNQCEFHTHFSFMGARKSMAIIQWLKEANEQVKNNAEKMIGQTMYWLLQR